MTSLLEPVRAGEVYTIPQFQQRTGMSTAALRAAFRAGLRRSRVGKRVFVVAEAWLDFVRSRETATAEQ